MDGAQELSPITQEIKEKIHTIRTPQFILDQPKVTREDAMSLARTFNLPNITGNEENDAQIGLYFCRGRQIDTATAKDTYSQEAKSLPHTEQELLSYFQNVSKADIEQEIKKNQSQREQLDSDLFNYERDLLKLCNVTLPDHITNLDHYFTWLAQHCADEYYSAYIPNPTQLEAFKFAFYKNYAGILGKVYTYFDPVSEWEQYVEKLLQGGEYSKTAKDRTKYIQNETFYNEFIKYRKPDLLNKILEERDYPKNSLLFHVTDVKSALNIVTSGTLLSGYNLGGPSFATNGLTHPLGGTHIGQGYIAFVSQYEQLRQACNALPFPEGDREYENEVRSPLPTSVKLMAGAVPVNKHLFPQVLKTGYAGGTLIGGEIIDIWRQNYDKHGCMFNQRNTK